MTVKLRLFLLGLVGVATIAARPTLTRAIPKVIARAEKAPRGPKAQIAPPLVARVKAVSGEWQLLGDKGLLSLSAGRWLRAGWQLKAIVKPVVRADSRNGRKRQTRKKSDGEGKPATVRLVLWFENGETRIVLPSKRAYIVPLLPGTALSSERIAAGRTRGDVNNPLYSPPFGENLVPGRVWPSRFVVRWSPYAKGTVLRVTVTSKDDSEQIWPDRATDDNEGKITDDGSGEAVLPGLRLRLNDFRSRRSGGDLVLTMEAEGRPAYRVLFQCLTEEQEESLLRELAGADGMLEANNARLRKELPEAERPAGEKYNRLAWRVHRASVFQLHRLYTEAAEELERALSESPRDKGLIKGAIWAHMRSGNLLRRNYWRKRL